MDPFSGREKGSVPIFGCQQFARILLSRAIVRRRLSMFACWNASNLKGDAMQTLIEFSCAAVLAITIGIATGLAFVVALHS
jgi:hypothetical protein